MQKKGEQEEEATNQLLTAQCLEDDDEVPKRMMQMVAHYSQKHSTFWNIFREQI